MERCLYLDTARLGLLKPSARRLYQDFVRFAGEAHFGLYWDEFLTCGVQSLPDGLRRSYPALEAWQGIGPFKASLKRLAGASAESQVLIANRSAQLMKLAAKLLFRTCRNVLVTDLIWPGYWQILRRERNRTGKQTTSVSLRVRLLREQLPEEVVINLIADTYVLSRCDGLFLPAVDSLGIKLPVSTIVQAIRKRAELRFAVVDGAQALAHLPLRQAAGECDMLIAGGHKWLGAHHPLGFGFLSPAACELPAIDDPLLRFTGELERGEVTRYGETVNVTPMLTAQAAANDCDSVCLADTLRTRIANADEVATRIESVGWKLIRPAESLRSGILLIRSQGERRHLPPETLRQLLARQGIAATAYPHGLIRLSMPDTPWEDDELEHLLQSLGNGCLTGSCG